MKPLYERPDTLVRCLTHYCAGCGHGIVHRLIAEVIEELGIRGRTIGAAPVGCAVLAHQYLKVDMCEPAHGRTPEVMAATRARLAAAGASHVELPPLWDVDTVDDFLRWHDRRMTTVAS